WGAGGGGGVGGGGKEPPPLLPDPVFASDLPECQPTELAGEVLPAVPEPGIVQEAQAALASEAVAQKRCGWCSAMNPWTVGACETCGARFPTPEQDEAFRRASEQRLQDDESALELLRLRRVRRDASGFCFP